MKKKGKKILFTISNLTPGTVNMSLLPFSSSCKSISYVLYDWRRSKLIFHWFFIFWMYHLSRKRWKVSRRHVYIRHIPKDGRIGGGGLRRHVTTDLKGDDSASRWVPLAWSSRDVLFILEFTLNQIPQSLSERSSSRFDAWWNDQIFRYKNLGGGAVQRRAGRCFFTERKVLLNNERAYV